MQRQIKGRKGQRGRDKIGRQKEYIYIQIKKIDQIKDKDKIFI